MRAYYQNGIDSKTGAHKPSYWDTSNWHDVVSIKQDTGFGNHYLFGFRVDGTILVTGQDANTYFSFLPELKDVDCILHAEVYKEKTSFTYVSKDDNVYTRDKEADQFILEKGPSSRHVIQVMDDFYLCADGTAYSKGSQKSARVYKYYCGAPQDCVAVVEGSYENDFCTYLNTEGIVRGRGKRGNFVWNNIVAIKGDFYKCIGLTNDGRLLYYDMDNGRDNGEILEARLFDSIMDVEDKRSQFLEEIKKNNILCSQAELDALNRQLSDAQRELSNLKGFFTGKRSWNLLLMI